MDKSSNGATRCTILIDDTIYMESAREAMKRGLKIYEYVNFVLAKAIGMKPPEIRHKPVHKKKEPPKNGEQKVTSEPVPGGTV